MTVKRRVFKQYYGYVDSKNCPVNVANKHIYGAVHHEFIANEGIKPTCDPNGVYSVKRTCAELGISHKTLRKYRERGYIRPINPDNVCRPKYLGQSIIDCWNILIAL